MPQSSYDVVSYVKSRGSHISPVQCTDVDAIVDEVMVDVAGKQMCATNRARHRKRATDVVVHTQMMENVLQHHVIVKLVISMDTIRSNVEIEVTAHLVADDQTKINQCGICS